MLLSYLGHGGPGGNSSNDEKKPHAVDNSDLAKQKKWYLQTELKYIHTSITCSK